MFTSPPSLASKWSSSVPDPDLEIGGGGGAAGQSKKFFGPKIRGGRPPGAPPLDPPLKLLSFARSYFEKGCPKKCARQSRKVLWVVLGSLFFAEF